MVRKKKKSRVSRDFFFTMSFLLVMSILIGCFLGYLWIHNTVTETIKENVALRKMERQLENRNKELRSEISELSRGDRIKRIAREQLHMQSPEPESLIVFIDSQHMSMTE